jgi:hypothetical protein
VRQITFGSLRIPLSFPPAPSECLIKKKKNDVGQERRRKRFIGEGYFF